MEWTQIAVGLLGIAVTALLGVVTLLGVKLKSTKEEGITAGMGAAESLRMKAELIALSNGLKDHAANCAVQFTAINELGRSAKAAGDSALAGQTELKLKVDRVSQSQDRHAGKIDAMKGEFEVLRTQIAGVNRRQDDISAAVIEVKTQNVQIIQILLERQKAEA